MGKKQCAPKGLKIFKDFSERIGSESIADLIWTDLDGDVDHIKTKEQIAEAVKTASKNLLASTYKASEQLEGIEDVPLSKFTDDQVKEIVDNLIFLAVWDGKAQQIKDIDKINLSNLKQIVEWHRDDQPEVFRNNYNEILKEENFKELMFEVERELAGLKIKPDLDGDPDSKNEGSQYSESFLVKNLDRARVGAKLNVAFLVEDKNGEVLNLKKFSDFISTWNDLENILSNIPYDPNVSDRYEQMIDILRDNIYAKPQYSRLISFLESANENTKTQFVRSLDNFKIEYLMEVISSEDYGQRGPTLKYMTSEGSSKVSKLLNSWDSNYKRMLTTGKRNNIKPNVEVAKRILDNYEKINEEVESKDADISKLKDYSLKLLSALGIEMDTRSFDAYLKNKGTSEIEALRGLYRRGGIIHLVKGKGKNLVSQIAKGELVTDESYGIKSPLLENAIVIELANIQKRFEENLESNSQIGPDGNVYQLISQHDFMSKAVTSINNDNTYLDFLDKSHFNKSSKFIEHLMKDENKGKLKLQTFLSRRLDGKDIGLDINSVSEIDEISSRVGRVNRGQLPYLTAADKNKVYYFDGLPTSKYRTSRLKREDVDQILDYLAAELNTMRHAWEAVYGDNPIPKKKQTENYHYKVDKETGERVPGNAFTLSTFPELSPGTELAKELDLYDEDNNNKPYPVSTSYVSLREDSIVTGIEKLRTYIQSSLNSRIEEATNLFMDKMITLDEKGNYSETSFDNELYKEYIEPNKLNVREGVKIIATNYVVNTTIANIEFTKLFTGDPRMYKSIEDYLKRTPATTATGDYLRIVKGEVNETFKIAIAPDVIFRSDLLNTYETDVIYDFLAPEIDGQKQELSDEEKENVNKILQPYDNVDRTDAQAFITLDRFKEIQIGLGEWSDEMNRAFNIIKNPNIKSTYKHYEVFMKANSTMQPRKGVHYELVDDGYGNLVPVYLKYSQAILFPEFISSSPILNRIAEQMTKQGVSELVVQSGIKSGNIEPTIIEGKVGEDIDFNTMTLSNRNWKLQVDLPSKNVKSDNGLVGSQIKKNIIADIDMEAMYGEMTGAELVKAIHETDIELSNKGLDRIKKQFKSKDNKVNKQDLYDILIKEFKSEGASKDLIDALESGVPIDNLLSHKSSIWSKISSMWNKQTVKVKQPGGSAIQISDYGFERGADFKIFEEVRNKDKNGIIWLKDTGDMKLNPPMPKMIDGKPVMQPGEVLMPYNSLPKLFGKEWKNIKELSPSEIIERIDPEVFDLIGYRIPNQALASNDSLRVVGILPPHAGDSIVAYSEITKKTGSDFDIDKMYYIRPAIKYNKDTKRVEKVRYDNSKSISENSEEQVQSRRIDLYKMVLESPNSYLRLMNTIDGDFVKDQINIALPKKKLDNLELYDGNFQMKIRREFLGSKGGVGQVANHQSDHAISQGAGLSIVDNSGRLDIGHLTENGDLDLSQKYSKKFEVIDQVKDKSGNITGYKISKTLDNNYYITEVISAYMNAFVDAAKDNYIGRANFNSLTNETAFFLIRNGVGPQYVNALIAQPVIRKYVELTNNKEGQAVPTAKVKPLNKIMKDLNLSTEELRLVNNSKLSDFSTKDLMDMLIDSSEGKTLNPIDEAQILSLFLHAQSIAKINSAQLRASKADTSVHRDLKEAYIMEHIKANVFNMVNEEGKELVGNFKNKFDNKSLGTYHKNGITEFINNFGHLSVMGTNNIQFAANKIYADIYGELPSDYKKLNPIIETVYAAMLSTNPAFNKGLTNSNNNGIADLMLGENSMAVRLDKFKDNPEYKTNKLIDMLYSRYGTNTLQYVGIDNTKQKDQKVKDRITSDWLKLYNSKNNEEHDFARDLAIFAFHTSALQDNIGSLQRLIPHRVLSGIGLTEDSHNMLKSKLNNPQDEDTTFNIIYDNVFKNLWRDTKIIPKISNKQSLAVGKFKSKEDKYKVFAVNEISSPALVVGYDTDNNIIFKPYVQKDEIFYDQYQNKYTNNRLYKYRGNIEITGKDGETYVQGVYERVGKLGETTKRGNKFFEFTLGQTKESIVIGNNYSLSDKDRIGLVNVDPVPPGQVNLKNQDIVPDIISEELIEEVSKVLPYSDYLEVVEMSTKETIQLQANEGPLSEEQWNEMSEKEKQNRLDCLGGGSTFKAEKGVQFGFTPGSKWKVIKNFKGKSHDNGGIDINISDKGIAMSNKNGKFKAENGMLIDGKGMDNPEYSAMSKVISQRNNSIPWVQRGLAPDDYPKFKNEDGSESSHVLSAEVDDKGDWYVFPTLERENDKWIDMRTEDYPQKAFDYAKKNKSAIKMPSKEMALYYSRNGLIKH